MSLLNLNYFEIFGIEAQITIDIEHLNKKYLTLQSEFHPDKFVNASNLEKSMATRISTYINDAYNTLSDLVERVAQTIACTTAPSFWKAVLHYRNLQHPT